MIEVRHLFSFGTGSGIVYNGYSESQDSCVIKRTSVKVLYIFITWHHQLDGHEFEQAPGVGDGQGSLVCCGPWGRKESDTTERLN